MYHSTPIPILSSQKTTPTPKNTLIYNACLRVKNNFTKFFKVEIEGGFSLVKVSMFAHFNAAEAGQMV